MNLKLKTLFAIIFLSLATLATAQVTISPLNAEFGKKARGQFQLTNGGFTPLSDEVVDTVVGLPPRTIGGL